MIFRGFEKFPRGPKIGFCAICRQKDNLSRDHVPPAGCGNITDVELQQAFPDANFVKSYSQGGSHFRTLCSRCNNLVLGSWYDPELVKFHSEVMKYIKASVQKITIPQHSFHYIKPNLIAKSVAGHLLAANSVDLLNEHSQHYEHAAKLANYVLDPTAQLPDDFDIYFWIYPHKDIRAIKTIGVGSFLWEGTVICDVLKFLPFSFLIINNLQSNVNINYQKLVKNKNAPTDSMELFCVNYTNIPHQGFPEYPQDSDNHFVLLNLKTTSISKKRNV